MDNASNQPSKFRVRNWVEINNYLHRAYNTNSQIKFTTSMLKSSSCDYTDAYILVKGTITVVRVGATKAAVQVQADINNKQAILKNIVPFTDCVTEMNNMQGDKVKDLDVIMLMYGLIEYSQNYSKTLGSSCQCWRDEPENGITDSEPFKFKSRFLSSTNNNSIINFEVTVPLKYLSNFWRTLEMPIINC